MEECEAYLVSIEQKDISGADNFRAMAKQACEHMEKLNAIYAELPTRFENRLEFKALKITKASLLKRFTAKSSSKRNEKAYRHRSISLLFIISIPRFIEEPGEISCGFRLDRFCCAHDSVWLPQ